jgi:hypothetical protein
MDADSNLLSLSFFSLLGQKNAKQEKRKFFSLLSFIFFSSSSQSRTFRNCSDVHSFDIYFLFQTEPKRNVEVVNIYYGSKTFKSIINDYSSLSFSNRYLFDYGQWSIRFSICLVQWYVYVRINTFRFFFFYPFLDRLNQQLNIYISQISSIKTGVKIIVKLKETVKQYLNSYHQTSILSHSSC